MALDRKSAQFSLHVPRYTPLLVGALLAFLLSSCGGGGTGSGGGTPPPTSPTVTSVTVSCASSALLVDQTDLCSASVQGTDNPSQTVTWSVNSISGGNATVGTISSAGLYTAPDPIPATGSTLTIAATSQIDSTKSGNAAVSLSYQAPVLISVAPPSVDAGSSATSLALAGSGFSHASQVTMNGNALPTQWVSSNQLTAAVSPTAQLQGIQYQVIVVNPAPGGGSSAASAFIVNNLAPSVLQVSPPTASVGDPGTPITISGTFFSPGASAMENGKPLPTTFLSSNTLTSTIPSSDEAKDVTYAIAVINPTPSDGPSNAVAFTVGAGSDNPALMNDAIMPGAALPDPSDRVVVIDVPGQSTTSQSTGAQSNGSMSSTQESRRSIVPEISSQTCGQCPSGAICITSPQCVPWIPQGIKKADGKYDWDLTMNCGPASLAMIESWIGSASDPEAVYLQIAKDMDKGTYPDGPRSGFGIKDLTSEAKKQQLTLQPINGGSLASLKEQLASGNPVIVGTITQPGNSTDVMSPLSANPICGKGGIHCPHFMVLVGMDDQYVYLDDPGRGASADGFYKRYTRDSFYTTWGEMGYDAAFIVPKFGIDMKDLNVVNGKIVLTDGVVGNAYAAVLSPTGYSGNVLWSIVSGTPPPGLTIDSSDGVHAKLDFTPTAAGSYDFNLQLKDASGDTAQGEILLNVQPGSSPTLAILTGANLPEGQAGVAYSSIWLSAAGGIGPYLWTATGSVPIGMTIGAGGQISGTPTQAGDYSFAVSVADGSAPPLTASQTETVTILPAIMAPYIQQIVANPATLDPGGTSALDCKAKGQNGDVLMYSWSATGGDFDQPTQEATNWTAPKTTGTYTVTCTVSDQAQNSVSLAKKIPVSTSSNLSVSVAPTTGTVNSTPFTITGTGATPNGTVTAASTLPDGTQQSFTTTATSSGGFTFGPFKATEVGTYSEVYSDKTSGAVSNTVTFTVNAASGALTGGITPSNPVVGVTPVTFSGTATPNATVTLNQTAPDQTTAAYTYAANSSGNYSSTGTFIVTQLGTYSGVLHDSISGQSKTVTYSGTGDFGASVNTTSQTVTAGGSASYTVTFSSVGGFAGTVTPGAVNATVPGATTSWSPQQVTVPSNGSVNATFTIQTSASTTAGTYGNIDLYGQNGSIKRAANLVSLTVK